MARKDLKLLLFILAVGVFIGLYLGVYNTFNTKTDNVESSIATLQPRLKELKQYKDNIPLYQSAITQAKTDMATIASAYPNDVRAEDKIMFAVDLENEVGVTVGSISLNEPEPQLSFTGISEGEHDSYNMLYLNMYKSSCTFTLTFTYQTLKDTVNYIYSRPYITNINTLSVSYDSTNGQLYGNILVDKFYITGLDTEYHETVIPDVGAGTDNIFGTVGG